MSYINCLPNELKELLLLYISDREIVELLCFPEFVSTFQSKFWKRKLNERLPNEYRDNMDPLYYINKVTQTMETNIIKDVNIVKTNYIIDREHMDLSGRILQLKLEIENLEEKRSQIEKEYSLRAKNYDNTAKLKSYIERCNSVHCFRYMALQQHIKRIGVDWYVEFSSSTKTSMLNLLKLSAKLTNLQNSLLFGIVTADDSCLRPIFLIYIFLNEDNKLDYDYSIVQEYVMSLPKKFIENMISLNLNAKDIMTKYELPFIITDSDLCKK